MKKVFDERLLHKKTNFQHNFKVQLLHILQPNGDYYFPLSDNANQRPIEFSF